MGVLGVFLSSGLILWAYFSHSPTKTGVAYLSLIGFIYLLFIFLNDFIYLFMRDRERERERERESETQAEGEAGSMHREPDVGFDPGSPGSRPGPKAGAKPLRHPGIPRYIFFY